MIVSTWKHYFAELIAFNVKFVLYTKILFIYTVQYQRRLHRGYTYIFFHIPVLFVGISCIQVTTGDAAHLPISSPILIAITSRAIIVTLDTLAVNPMQEAAWKNLHTTLGTFKYLYHPH